MVSSASGSAFIYLFLKLFRKWSNRKQRLYGLYLCKGKQYSQDHLTDKNHIFINFDKLLLDKVKDDFNVSHLLNISQNDKLIKVYPKAIELKKQLKLTHLKKKIIFCSSDPELLEYLNLKKIFYVIPNNEFTCKLKDIFNDNFDKVCLILEYVKAKNNNLYQVNSFLQQSEKIIEKIL